MGAFKLGNIQLQAFSVSGIPFCGTDIGGFSGEPDGELFTRWIQMGTFSPFMRAHSAGDTKEREPWSFGEPFTAINRKFIELRYTADALLLFGLLGASPLWFPDIKADSNA
jgi:alpha-glucosidase